MAAQKKEDNGEIDSAIIYLKYASEQGDLPAQMKVASLISQQRSKPWIEIEHSMSLDDRDMLIEEARDLEQYWPQYLNEDSHQSDFMTHRSDWDLRISPGKFMKIFDQAAEKGSPYAALEQIRLRLQYPTLIEQSRTSIEHLANIASEITSGKVLKARLILKGQLSGTPDQAWSLLHEAATDQDPYALFAMSMLKRHQNNLSDALHLYTQALAMPNIAHPLYQAACDVLDGTLGFEDGQSAYDSLYYLAQSDYPPALVYLAQAKSKGFIAGTPEEIFLFRYKAAWQGMPAAQYALAHMYYIGEGVHQDHVKAFRWYMQSARSGYRPAQYQVGQMNLHAQGTLPSAVKAYAWQTLSLRGLYEDPQYESYDLTHELSWDQLAEALALIERYKNLYDRTAWA